MAMPQYDVETERPNRAAFQAGLARLTASLLADQSILWASLLGGIGIWGFALFHPDTLRLIAAGGYSLSIFIPVLWKKG